MHYQNRIVCFCYIVCFLGMSVTFFPRIQRVISQISPQLALCSFRVPLENTCSWGFVTAWFKPMDWYGFELEMNGDEWGTLGSSIPLSQALLFSPFFSLRQGSLGKRGASREEEDEGETGAPMEDDYGGSTDEEQSQSPPRTQARTAPLRGTIW